ncbi:uncharacterized protein LOC128997566 [Macrosteles quadrilineatus]|uniref:uncharacterized protein LOC128997566 n=1 Tax=Macrosteles quadrilineatus TaxID=74068 RepID=UPI0023E296E2|nr:uncharacterized protein LOC128997566 [Macrosteles quadrilineatus]
MSTLGPGEEKRFRGRGGDFIMGISWRFPIEECRKGLRSVFTKKAKAIEELVDNNADLRIILPKYNSFKEFHEKLQKVNEKVLSKLIENENANEEDIEKEMTTASEYNEKYHEITIDERVEIVKKKGACLRCLRKGHLASKCRLQVKCIFCKGNHLTVLCKKVQTNDEKSEVFNKKEPEQNSTNSVTTTENKVTYLQTLSANILGPNNAKKRIRILCDSGSQKSFVTEECARQLGLKPKGSVLIQQEVLGGRKMKPRQHAFYTLALESLSSDYRMSLNVLEQPTICSQVPQLTDQNLIDALKKQNIILTDIPTATNTDHTNIDVLIGADAWTNIITNEFLKVSDQLVAIRTQLGWTVVGTSNRKSSFVSTMFASTLTSDIGNFWDVEPLGIADPIQQLNKKEKDAKVLEHSKRTVNWEIDGRYVVKLPWIYPPLKTNRHAAEKRLQTTAPPNGLVSKMILQKTWTLKHSKRRMTE